MELIIDGQILYLINIIYCFLMVYRFKLKKKMQAKFTISVLIFLFFSGIGLSQSNGTISGSVFDANSEAPIEYSNVILFSKSDSSQITGTVTNSEGNFTLNRINFGNYYLTIQFIGYGREIIDNVSLSEAKNKINLGKIYIKPTAVNLGDVVVEGERAPVSYQIDKKVIDVSQMQTSISGNAAEVLENIPSVTVDIEGNVSLRGSSSFTVLIDGRPSVMDAQDALQQIPASSIETIEIITNPSAKYDPEGNAGIINIKLKKNKNLGLSGIINANAGVNDKYGGDFLFEYKTPNVNYNFSLDYNKRLYPGNSRQEETFELDDNISFMNSFGQREWRRKSFGLRGGIDLTLTEKDLLSFGGRYGYRDRHSNSLSNYTKWTSKDPLRSSYSSNSNRLRTGDYYVLNVNYTKKFSQESHQISSEFFISHDNSDESTISSEIENSLQFDGKKTTEAGPSTEFNGRIDYTLPLGENGKFEAGTKGEYELSEEENKFYQFSNLSNDYEFQSAFSNNTKYDERELAIYSLYSNEINNFGFQAGLRTEYTYIGVDITKTNQRFNTNRWDYFPTLHSSYKFSPLTQIMASYTRRIDRPGGWQLEPFLTWINSNNVRTGNPALKPEFIDSYEIGFQTFFGKIFFSNEIYYRFTHNKVERITSVYAENVTLSTVNNVGTDYSLGSEFMFTFDPIEKFWGVSLSGDLYNYRVEGILDDQSFNKQSFTWNARISNNFKIGKNTQIELNARYNSPRVSSQDRREGYFRSDIAVRQDFFNKSLSLTVQVRDLFKTSKYESFSEGIGYFSHSFFTRESPMVMLNLKFNFNNYKNKEKPQPGEPGFEEGGNEEFN